MIVKIFLFQAIQFSLVKALIQTIQSCISIVFVCTLLNIKIVPFQAVQFSISTQFSSIWPIDRTLSGATTPGQSGTGSNGNEGVLLIPESNSITGTSPSDCLVSHPGHSLGKSYPPAEEPTEQGDNDWWRINIDQLTFIQSYQPGK